MGAFIAADFALAGHEVRFTVSERTSPDAALARVSEAAGAPCAGQLRFARSTANAARQADLVLEALPEDLALKQRELSAAQEVAPRAILATNTSSLRIGSIASALSEPSRLVGAHYVNPPWAFRLVELIAGEATDPAVLDEMEAILRSTGREPVRVARDVPGFVFNRLQFALLREAMHLVDTGVATPADVDRVVTDGLGRRLALTGPFRTAALGGAPLFARIAEALFPALSRAERPSVGALASLQLSPQQLEDARRARDEALAAHPDVPWRWRPRDRPEPKPNAERV